MEEKKEAESKQKQSDETREGHVAKTGNKAQRKRLQPHVTDLRISAPDLFLPLQFHLLHTRNPLT